jgi:hypothetical protein
MGPIQRFQDFSAQWDTHTQSKALDFERTVDFTNHILRGV